MRFICESMTTRSDRAHHAHRQNDRLCVAHDSFHAKCHRQLHDVGHGQVIQGVLCT